MKIGSCRGCVNFNSEICRKCARGHKDYYKEDEVTELKNRIKSLEKTIKVLSNTVANYSTFGNTITSIYGIPIDEIYDMIKDYKTRKPSKIPTETVYGIGRCD